MEKQSRPIAPNVRRMGLKASDPKHVTLEQASELAAQYPVNVSSAAVTLKGGIE